MTIMTCILCEKNFEYITRKKKVYICDECLKPKNHQTYDQKNDSKIICNKNKLAQNYKNILNTKLVYMQQIYDDYKITHKSNIYKIFVLNCIIFFIFIILFHF